MSQTLIDSLADPRLELYRSLKKSNSTRDQTAFVAEGPNVVERLLQSGVSVLSVLAVESHWQHWRSLVSADIPLYGITQEVASQLLGYRFHQGVLAVGRRPVAASIDSLLPRHGASLVFVADHIVDPQNMGLLVRIAAGFGADVLLVSGDSADPFSRRAIRVSTGNCFFLPITECARDLPQTLQKLAQYGYTCCATVLENPTSLLHDFTFPAKTALVFGNESTGMSPLAVAHCQQRLAISMLGGTDSFNVAIAAGIFGYAYRAIHPDNSSWPGL